MKQEEGDATTGKSSLPRPKLQNAPVIPFKHQFRTQSTVPESWRELPSFQGHRGAGTQHLSLAGGVFSCHWRRQKPGTIQGMPSWQAPCMSSELAVRGVNLEPWLRLSPPMSDKFAAFVHSTPQLAYRKSKSFTKVAQNGSDAGLRANNMLMCVLISERLGWTYQKMRHF